MNEAVKRPVDVLERVVQTLLGDSERPDYADLIAAAAERYGQTTPFVRTLKSYVQQHTRDLRGLEGLVILSFGCREAAQRERIDPVREARRLVEGLVNTGDTVRASRLLEYLNQVVPGDAELMREWESVARHARERQRPLEHYLRQAQEADRRGDKPAAIRHLRNALRLEPSRRDIAQWISDLSRGAGRPRTSYVLGRLLARLLLVGAIAGLVALGVMFGADHERRAQERWDALPSAGNREIPELEERLAALELFVDDVWLWSGMFRARAERVRLATELDALRRGIDTERQTRWVIDVDEDRVLADSALREARALVREGSMVEAVEAYERALARAPEGWGPRAEVVEDLETIRAHLAQERPR